jgi:DNA-binding transcriptional regulator/RsmH inhibitor MraZ
MIINNKKYIFKLNDDKSVTIEESGRIFQTIHSNKMNKLSIEEEIIIIGKLSEIEINGSFLFNSDAFKKFNQDEVKTLFTNINASQMNAYNYVIMEIKLNKTKIMELK